MTDTATFPLAGKRVMVAGHCGMAGSSIVRRLERAHGAAEVKRIYNQL